MSLYVHHLMKKIYEYSSKGQVFKSANDPLSERVLETSADSSQIAVKNHREMARTPIELLNAMETRTTEVIRRGESKQILDEVTFNDPANIQIVLKCLRDYGVAIFPKLYHGEALSRIRSEYHDIIRSGKRLADAVHTYENKIQNSFGVDFKRHRLNSAKHRELRRLFGSEILWKISQAYFYGQSFEFNKDLFAQWTEHTEVPLSGDLHWDRQLTLKSFLYLSEATEGYGAMRVQIGSSAWTRYLREDAMFDGIPYDSIKNKLDEPTSTISTGGPAGTFFIFVTDTGHGATPVKQGKRREIIRSQSRPHRITDWASWAMKL